MRSRSIKLNTFLLLTGFSLPPSPAFAALHISDLPAHETQQELKYQSIQSVENKTEGLGGFDELVPYVLPSPDQEDAGSCLYMAITGIAEWWLARLNPDISRVSDGPLDLSERYTMNIASSMDEDDIGLKNWRTDAIYIFNQNAHQALLNTTYRYTKNWYLGETYSAHLTASNKSTPGAEYGTLFNWIDQKPENPSYIVQLPEFERKVIFADPDNNQWNIGVAPETIVDQVKTILRTEKSPILVIYNHNSYWHAVYIIGYNDDIDNQQCAYTERFRTRIKDRAEELDKSAEKATDPIVKSAYEIRAKRAHEAQDKIETAYAAGGGCTSSKGVFYIRDSIYPDENGDMYHYDLSHPENDTHYTKKIVFKEYDWLRYFANNISVVYPKQK